MNLEQYLLTCLGEEAGEINKATSKATRFGLDDVWEGKPTTNRQDIVAEFNDLVGVIELIEEHGISLRGLYDRKAIEAKKEKVLRMMRYSRDRGRLGGYL